MNRRAFSIAVLACCLAFIGVPRTSAAEPNPSPASGPHIVFLVSKDPSNYKAHETIPVFAEMLRNRYGCSCTVIRGEGEPTAFRFPGLKAIRDADLLVVFFRRRAPSNEQLGMIREYLAAGKPLVGIRTANHAFAVKGTIAKGHGKWDTFCSEVLGCGNHGYGPGELGTDVRFAVGAADNPILANVKPTRWHSGGSLYLVKPIDKAATVLLTGSVGDKSEPVAWTRMYRKSRVFYTSLGYQDDFQLPQFTKLLVNGLFWAMDRPTPTEAASAGVQLELELN